MRITCPPTFTEDVSKYGSHSSPSASSSGSLIDSDAVLVQAQGSPWEYPLTAAEKKERLGLLFRKEEALAREQVQRGEKILVHVRKELLSAQRNEACLQNERSGLREQVNALYFEKRQLQSRVEQLLVQVQHQPISPSPPSQRNGSKEDELQTNASGLCDSFLDDTPRTTNLTQVATPDMSAIIESTATPTARRPRLSSTRMRRGSLAMRGTIASVSWNAAPGVRWMEFTSRASGLSHIFGRGHKDDVALEHEDCSMALRRGEYISSISVALGTPGQFGQIAHSIRISTSEQQEVVVGLLQGHFQACSSSSSEISATNDLTFEASFGHEIVGLELDNDGCTCGVRQVALAPPRVAASSKPSSPEAKETIVANALAPVCLTQSARPFNSRRPSLSGLLRHGGTISRIREAFDDIE